MKAQDILAKAAAHMAKRAEQYDRPQGERSVPAVVEAFNAIKGSQVLNYADGWLFLNLLKMVRAQTAKGQALVDSVEDATAYSALLGEEMLATQEPFKVGELPKPGPIARVPQGIAPWPHRAGEKEVAEEQQKRNRAARDAMDELVRRGIARDPEESRKIVEDFATLGTGATLDGKRVDPDVIYRPEPSERAKRAVTELVGREPGSVHRSDTGERIVTNTGQQVKKVKEHWE